MPGPVDERDLKRLYKRRAMVDQLIEQLEEYARHSTIPAGISVPRALIFTPEPVAAEGLREAVSGAGLNLVAVCGSISELGSHCESSPPDLAILHLGPACPLDEIAALRARAPQCAVVLWAESISMEVVGRALQIGVRGVLSTRLPVPVLVESLVAVSKGEIQVNLPSAPAAPLHRGVRLTRRQRMLLPLVGQGLKNKEIATAMGTTEGTVKAYLNRLCKVLGAGDRFEVALYAMEMQAAADRLPLNPHDAACYTMVASESNRERSLPWQNQAFPGAISSSAPSSPGPFRRGASAASPR